ncbi:thiamine pyrophosphate-binding protein [Streptomyces sp. NPDC026672]|uniref:thiamine pyrophosphate-binding protein n=1 Tax=unclassified Streptomyces TaxID=2593676 RepID=UPI0033E8F358
MTGAAAPETVRGCWRAVTRLLERDGVRAAFGLPADDLDLLAALDGSGIRLVVCRDQRNALFMATGHALQSGATGIAFTGKGPAVTNALTGLLEAKYSAVPLVLLAAGTAVDRLGAGAFQEADQLALAAPLVKWAARVDDPGRLAPMLTRALLVAREGVPGPVYLELPDHLLTADVPLPEDTAHVERPTALRLDPDADALRVLRGSERPLLVLGGGVRHRTAPGALERFAERTGAAVFCTASGRGAFDETHPQFCGLTGLYLPDEAAGLWEDTDCVLTLGSRLEETATHGWPDTVGHEVPVVQVNVDAAEFRTGLAGPKVLADVTALLAGPFGTAPSTGAAPGWTRRVRDVHHTLHRHHHERLRDLAAHADLRIPEVLAALADVLPDDLVLVQENGLQDMWSYRYPVHVSPARGGSVVPSEQTSLGFGAAAAVGVAVAAPGRPVVALVGDGAFGLFEPDLPTLAEARLGVLYVVLRNGGYGWLQSQLDQREPPTTGHRFLSPEPSRSSTHGLPGLHRLLLDDRAALHAVVEEAWKLCRSGESVLLDVPVRLADSLFHGSAGNGDFPLPSAHAPEGDAS